MKSVVIVFPGSNCDKDAIMALQKTMNHQPKIVWHRDSLPKDVDLVIVPGGFSYGDYLRCGAMAAHSPAMQEVVEFANKGGKVLGICNGFQILTETGLLPGALIRNADLRFVCRDVQIKIANNENIFTNKYNKDEIVTFPVAHHDGNYFIDENGLKEIEDNNQVIFRYAEAVNGSLNDIAGISNKAGNVVGLMPHPERATDSLTAGIDGIRLFESVQL